MTKWMYLALALGMLAGCTKNPVQEAADEVCACSDQDCAMKAMEKLEGLEAEAKKLPEAERKELDRKAEECAKKHLGK